MRTDLALEQRAEAARELIAAGELDLDAGLLYVICPSARLRTGAFSFLTTSSNRAVSGEGASFEMRSQTSSLSVRS